MNLAITTKARTRGCRVLTFVDYNSVFERHLDGSRAYRSCLSLASCFMIMLGSEIARPRLWYLALAHGIRQMGVDCCIASASSFHDVSRSLRLLALVQFVASSHNSG